MSFLQWLENSGVGQFIESNPWANLVLLCLHALGMGAVVGILWILDLRVLGYPKSLPLSTFKPLMRIAWWGFVINAVSGILMFAGAATRFIINTDFRLKMLLIVLGGVSVLILQRSLAVGPQDAEPMVMPAGAKVLAACSFLFWLGVIIFGRQIAYTLARPGI
ncbi:MAG: DUF6644 family protein [Steroidobacteraceae bacterium]